MSHWVYSETALDDGEARNFLKQFPEQENDANSNPIKSDHNAKFTAYPTPGNILHTGRQLLRTPGPGIPPPLPSQIFDPILTKEDSFEELFRSLSQNCVKKTENIVPCGRQIPRTPIAQSQEEQTEHKEPETHVQDSCKTGVNAGEISDGSFLFKKPSEILDNKDVKSPKKSTENQCPEHRPSETIREEAAVRSEQVADEVQGKNPGKVSECRNNVNRRISEIPVQGLNRMRISSVLRKLPGYECHDEDLEYLKHMQGQEKAKVLKAELLRLRKELTAANQNKELILAKTEKVDLDIQNLKEHYDRTVQLGRMFLCRIQDPGSVNNLSPEDVLKLLNPVSIQQVCNKESSRLHAAQRELRRKQKEVNTSHALDKVRQKQEICKQHVMEAESRVQQLQENIVELRSQVEKAQTDLADTEECLQKKRDQIKTYNNNHTAASDQSSNITEEDKEKLNRRLERLKHRKDLYLEREKILQRLNLCLQ
ncbi:uncharacterized protein O3C94_003204 [Discoglossus pictus]